MKLTKRGEYALRSLIALGVAQAMGRGTVRFAEVAAAEAIPESFLRWVLVDLDRAGFVEGGRGAAGDYRLGRPAGHIVVGDVVRLVDRPDAATGGSRVAGLADDGLGLLVRHVSGAVSGVLDKFTLADLVSVTVYHLRARGADAEHYLAGAVPEAARWPHLSIREEFLDGAGI